MQNAFFLCVLAALTMKGYVCEVPYNAKWDMLEQEISPLILIHCYFWNYVLLYTAHCVRPLNFIARYKN